MAHIHRFKNLNVSEMLKKMMNILNEKRNGKLYTEVKGDRYIRYEFSTIKVKTFFNFRSIT